MPKPYLPPEFYQVARHIGLPYLPKETESAVINSDGSLTLETAIAAQSIRRWADEAVNRLDKVLAEAVVDEIATRNGYTKKRTCTFTENWNDPDLPMPTCSSCGWEAEETDCVCVIGGPMFQYGGKFCKECGAKVVE